ncbi:MAG: hypothetical protein V1645_02595 [archaeon]
MIVQVDYRIVKPYAERLSSIRDVVLQEIERRKKHVNLRVFRMEKEHLISFGNELFGHTCYSCEKPIYFNEEELMFIERVPNSNTATYLHLSCVKQKV